MSSIKKQNDLQLSKLKKNELTISTGQVLPVSRSQADAVSEAFDSYYQKGGAFIRVDRV